MSSASVEISLLYVSASSPEELARACFLRQLALGKQITWHSVSFVKGNWYAWYSDHVNLSAMTKPLPPIKLKKDK